MSLSQCTGRCTNTAQLHQKITGTAGVFLDLILISKDEPVRNAEMEGNLHDKMKELSKRKRRENSWKISKI